MWTAESWLTLADNQNKDKTFTYQGVARHPLIVYNKI
jgi:hypothetical protein